jgi:hypothetical protein
MADKRRDIPQDLFAKTDKAIRRGKKLEKTLLKIVAQSEPGTSAEEFLKAVQLGMKKLRKEARALERSLPPGTKKAKTASEPGSTARKRSTAVPPVQVIKRMSRKNAADPDPAPVPDTADA